MQSTQTFATTLKKLGDATLYLKLSDPAQHNYTISMKYVMKGKEENFELHIKQKTGKGKEFKYINNDMDNIGIIMNLCYLKNSKDAENINQELITGFRNTRLFSEVLKNINSKDNDNHLKYSISKNEYNSKANISGHIENMYSIELDIGLNPLYHDPI